MRHLMVSCLYLSIVSISMSIITQPSPCFATTISVNCEKTYSAGSVTVPVSSAFDTIHFSNGISLSSFNQTTRIPEPVLLYHGICIDTTPNLVTTGYRYLPTATWKKLSSDSLSNMLISADTAWGLSKTYPDSLLRLASLYNSDPEPTFKRGSWLYSTDGDLSFGNWVSRMECFSTIIYLQSTRNKMKLHVSNLFISSTGGMQSRIDSLRILWAVDSLGNGLFKESTATQSSTIPSGSNSHAPLGRCYGKNTGFLQNSGNHISLFDIKGRQTQTVIGSSHIVASGIFIYKIDNSKAAILGRIK